MPFGTSPSMGELRIKNPLLSQLNTEPGSPTVYEAWRQYESFTFSSMNSCTLIGSLSYSASVDVAEACTAGSPILSLSLNKSLYCMYITLAYIFREDEGDGLEYLYFVLDQCLIRSGSL